VIIVIGSPIGRLVDGEILAAGVAARIALAAAAAGRTVQLVGKTGDDETADRVVLDLARGGVGHAALLRDSGRATPLEAPPDDDPAPPEGEGDDAGSLETASTDGDSMASEGLAAHGPALEAADVDLGLRYLTEFAVVVLAEPVAAEVVAIVADAARWGEAPMILVVGAGEQVPDGLPSDVVVFESPATDPDGAFAAMVGTFAAALDKGTDPGDAFRASVATDGWTGVDPA
jgi:hypothetical protein